MFCARQVVNLFRNNFLSQSRRSYFFQWILFFEGLQTIKYRRTITQTSSSPSLGNKYIDNLLLNATQSFPLYQCVLQYQNETKNLLSSFLVLVREISLIWPLYQQCNTLFAMLYQCDCSIRIKKCFLSWSHSIGEGFYWLNLYIFYSGLSVVIDITERQTDGCLYV